MSDIAVMPVKCGTCPFRDGSPYAALVPELTDCALTKASRICHSTGSNAINARTGKAPRICRGSRDVQIQQMHRLGVIASPTDQAWADAWAKMKNRKR